MNESPVCLCVSTVQCVYACPVCLCVGILQSFILTFALAEVCAFHASNATATILAWFFETAFECNLSTRATSLWECHPYWDHVGQPFFQLKSFGSGTVGDRSQRLQIPTLLIARCKWCQNEFFVGGKFSNEWFLWQKNSFRASLRVMMEDVIEYARTMNLWSLLNGSESMAMGVKGSS